MGDSKNSALSGVQLVAAVEWPVYELISGRLPETGDGVAGFSKDDFYAMFAPAYTQTHDTHTRVIQTRFRFPLTDDVHYTDDSGVDIAAPEGLIPLGTGYWQVPAQDADGEDWPSTPELRFKIDKSTLVGDHKYYRSIRELVSEAHAASIVFTTSGFAKIDDSMTSVVAYEGNAPTAGAVNDFMLGVNGAVAKALAIFNGSLDCASNTANVVSAREARTRPAHLRGMGKLRAAMGRNGMVFTTQFTGTLLGAETERLGEIGDLELKVVLGRESYRKTMLVNILENIVALRVTDLSWAQDHAKTMLAYDIQRMVSEHNQYELALQGGKANALWDLELYRYALKPISVLNGAPLVARPMTQNQRIAAAVTTGLGTGLQVGAATGNVAIGAVTAVVATAAQLIGMS